MTASSDAGVHYVIASLPRSGSNLLAHGLRRTGLAWNPEEHFNVRHQQRLLSEWGLDAMPPYREFVERAIVATKTPNGVFGTKIHWEHVPVMSAKLGEHGYGPALDDVDVLPHLFPQARYIRTVREDKIRQALSLYRAIKSDVWYRHDEAPPAPRGLTSLADVDFARVEKQYHALIAGERHWDDFFEAHGIVPLTLRFEDLTGSYARAVRSALRFLAISGSESIDIPPTRLAKQSDQLTEACVTELTARLAR